MQHHDPQLRCEHVREERVVVEEADLAAGAAEPLYTVSPGQQQEHLAGGGRTERRDIDRELLALRALFRWMHVMRDGQAARLRGIAKPGARFGVRRGEMGNRIEVGHLVQRISNVDKICRLSRLYGCSGIAASAVAAEAGFRIASLKS
jgi:hypothetical protein